MSRLRNFAKNTATLSAVALFMKAVGVIFNAYAANKIGAEGMGLYSLAMSVYLFAVTLSTSGINLAVTRLVSERLAVGDDGGALIAIRKCVIYALCFGTATAFLMFFSAPYLARVAVGDTRMEMSLRALSVSLPFIALSNVFSGYFYAVRRAFKSASSNMIEQFVKIVITCTLLYKIAPKGVEYACMALVAGTSISEGLSLAYLFVFYLFDRKKHIKSVSPRSSGDEIRRKMFATAVPVALSAYLRSGLVTIEHMLIPRGLKKFGADYSSSLAAYGTVSGMALPVILFPAALCSTFAGLIVPELSELAAKSKNIKNEREISYIIRRCCGAALLFGIGTGGIFLCFSSPLGKLIYGSEEAAHFIAALAPVVPLMYLDTTVDGMLKGLGEQLFSMWVNILDASMSVALVWILLPKMGIMGYIVCIFVTETVNCALSLGRLLYVTGAKINVFRRLVLPVLCISGACSVTAMLLRPFAPGLLSSCLLGIIFSVLIYVLFLASTGTLGHEEFIWLGKIFAPKKH